MRKKQTNQNRPSLTLLKSFKLTISEEKEGFIDHWKTSALKSKFSLSLLICAIIITTMSYLLPTDHPSHGLLLVTGGVLLGAWIGPFIASFSKKGVNALSMVYLFAFFMFIASFNGLSMLIFKSDELFDGLFLIWLTILIFSFTILLDFLHNFFRVLLKSVKKLTERFSNGKSDSSYFLRFIQKLIALFISVATLATSIVTFIKLFSELQKIA